MTISAPSCVVLGGRNEVTNLSAQHREHRPDVVLMDIRMAEMDGITATAALRRLDSPPHVIVLTTFPADEQVMSALRAEASGFLVKDTPPADIINAVRVVASGAAIISPSVTRTLLSHFGDGQGSDRRRAAAQRLAALTDREREVAVAIASGASNAEVATALFTSEATVKAHVSRLFTKLDVSNRVRTLSKPNIGSVHLDAWSVRGRTRPPTCDRESASPHLRGGTQPRSVERVVQ